MAESPATPLTDDERAELEALRAEKARREEEERVRAERAELEALRAEQAARESAASPASESASAPAPKAPKVPSPQAAPRAIAPAETHEPAEKSFGERMVTSGSVNGDGIPTMPMAQKIIIAICLIAVIGFAIFKLVL